jgi:hypothetical protein
MPRQRRVKWTRRSTGLGWTSTTRPRRRCDRPGAEKFSFWELLELRDKERGALEDVSDEGRLYSEHEIA